MFAAPSIRSYGATKFAAAWTVKTPNITTTFLDNETQLKIVTPQQNDKDGYRKYHDVVFSTSPDYVCSILNAVDVSGGSEENSRCQSVFNISTQGLHPV